MSGSFTATRWLNSDERQLFCKSYRLLIWHNEESWGGGEEAMTISKNEHNPWNENVLKWTTISAHGVFSDTVSHNRYLVSWLDNRPFAVACPSAFSSRLLSQWSIRRTLSINSISGSRRSINQIHGPLALLLAVLLFLGAPLPRSAVTFLCISHSVFI